MHFVPFLSLRWAASSSFPRFRLDLMPKIRTETRTCFGQGPRGNPDVLVECRQRPMANQNCQGCHVFFAYNTTTKWQKSGRPLDNGGKIRIFDDDDSQINFIAMCVYMSNCDKCTFDWQILLIEELKEEEQQHPVPGDRDHLQHEWCRPNAPKSAVI